MSTTSQLLVFSLHYEVANHDSTINSTLPYSSVTSPISLVWQDSFISNRSLTGVLRFALDIKSHNSLHQTW